MKKQHTEPDETGPGTIKEQEVKDTILRYLRANSTREELPAQTVKKLDEIKLNGVELLIKLQPYRLASIFTLAFMQDMMPGNTDEKTKKIVEEAIEARWEALADASVFMENKVCDFPLEFKNRNIETTCVLSALFAGGAIMRFIPDIILETQDKLETCDKFILFYENDFARFFKGYYQADNAIRLHQDIYAVYNKLKKEMPELFEELKKRLLVSGELMAPYGEERYAVSWLNDYYPHEEATPKIENNVVDLAKAQKNMRMRKAKSMSKKELLEQLEKGRLNDEEIDELCEHITRRSDDRAMMVGNKNSWWIIKNLITEELKNNPSQETADDILQQCIASGSEDCRCYEEVLTKLRNRTELTEKDINTIKKALLDYYWKIEIARLVKATSKPRKKFIGGIWNLFKLRHHLILS